MMAEISIIPLDKGTSLSQYVARILAIIDESGKPSFAYADAIEQFSEVVAEVPSWDIDFIFS